MADLALPFPRPSVLEPSLCRRFLTNPESDPLGLAAELYYARTGCTDYDQRLADQANPADTHGDVNDPTAHPFINIYMEQHRFNARLQEVGTLDQDREPYPPCRNRWHINLQNSPGYDKTPHCMRVYCPACWMLKVELGYAALAGAQAPVLGVTEAFFSLSEPTPAILTKKGLRSLVSPSDNLSARDRIKAWHPLFWALFPTIGLGGPEYRFVGIFVAAQILNRKSAYERTPQELAEFGLPRWVETNNGPTTAWERTFTGPDRTNDAWQAFRRMTPAPMITSTDDGLTPGCTDGDAFRAEAKTITWAQTRRSYLNNQTRFAHLITDQSLLTELKVDDIGKVYEEIRMARKEGLRRKLDCEEGAANEERDRIERERQQAIDRTRE